MIGQNSFSNTNTNPDIISSNSTPAPQVSQMSPTGQPQNTPKKSIPLPVAVAISFVAGILLAFGVYFLFLQPKNDATKNNTYTVDVKEASPDNDGTQTSEDTLNEFDKQISSTSDEGNKLDLLLNKAGYYIIIEDYDSAISTLDSIDPTTLDDYDQYRLYNFYSSAYGDRGDATQQERYRQLADEANARDLAE